MLKAVNLSISSACSARCVFCPVDRGCNGPAFMPPHIAEKVLREIAEPDFPWRIESMQVGENGDALLNPCFLEILRMIREIAPWIHVNLTTNFSGMTRGMSAAILSENLLDGIQLNIDGHDAETYEAQKRLSYSRVMENLAAFLNMRKEICNGLPPLPVAVSVLTLSDYADAIVKQPRNHMGPIPQSTFEQVKQSLSWLPADIAIRKSLIFTWAERVAGEYEGYVCPQLPRIETEAFISPGGEWYPCCLDSGPHLTFGNVTKNTMKEIYDSRNRAMFIELLKARRFSEIGFPCNAVRYCQVIG